MLLREKADFAPCLQAAVQGGFSDDGNTILGAREAKR
jgi:hypothetical protein